MTSIWLQRSLTALRRRYGINQPYIQTIGLKDPGRSGLRILAIADAVGASLQINLLRPMSAGVRAGSVRMAIFTEADERAALASGMAGEVLLSNLWRRSKPDAVFISRYGGSLAVLIADAAERTHTPLIYHLDDNLFEVPADAGVEKACKYGNPARQDAIRLLLSRSNIAYISTARLATQLAELGVSATNLFAGDIASASDCLRPPKTPSGSPTLGYMASSSHAADLRLALPGIVAAMKSIPYLKFAVFGSLKPPEALSEFGTRVSHIPAVSDYDAFLERLAKLDWDWGLAPLCAGRFNEAKTNTKWVEYAAAGVPCIASQHLVYEDCLANGTAVCVADADWADQLPRIVLDRELAMRTAEAAQNHLAGNYSLHRMRRQVQKVLLAAGVPEVQAAAISPSFLEPSR